MRRIVFLIAPILCFGVVATGCKSESSLKHFDSQQVDLLQFNKIEDGDDIAVIKTSKGDISIKFFEQEMAELVNEFKNISEQGYYNNVLIGVDSQAEKNNDIEINHISMMASRSRIYTLEQESTIPSQNLIHVPGAVSASLDSDGNFTGEFFIVSNRETPTTAIEDMESCRYPNDIVDKFEKHGGYPELWLKEPIFAQVYEGMNVVEEIQKDISQGSNDIEIISIQIYKHGEIK